MTAVIIRQDGVIPAKGSALRNLGPPAVA